MSELPMIAPYTAVKLSWLRMYDVGDFGIYDEGDIDLLIDTIHGFEDIDEETHKLTRDWLYRLPIGIRYNTPEPGVSIVLIMGPIE